MCNSLGTDHQHLHTGCAQLVAGSDAADTNLETLSSELDAEGMLALRNQAQQQWQEDRHPGWRLVPLSTDLAKLVLVKYRHTAIPLVQVSRSSDSLRLYALALQGFCSTKSALLGKFGSVYRAMLHKLSCHRLQCEQSGYGLALQR